MIQRNMRFVLEKDNMLTLRNGEGKCIQTQEGIVPEGHSLLLYSEDLSYITYGPSGFHYKRYNPESLAIEDEYTKPTDFSEDKYQDIFALASYNPKTRKAFFITISKTTRELWVYENDSSEPKKVDGKLPSVLWSNGIDFKKEVSFVSSYFGEGRIKYTVFLCGKDARAYWQFGIDIPKNRSEAPALVTLQENTNLVKSVHNRLYFGDGIDLSEVSYGRGEYVKFSTPVDEESMGSKSDSLFVYTLKYPIFNAILAFSIPILLTAIFVSLLFTILPQSWIDGYIALTCYGGTPECTDNVRDAKYLTYFFILVPIFISFAIAEETSKTFRRRRREWLGTKILSGNIRRASKVYVHKVRKIGTVLDFYQTSPGTIALLQADKIQLYNFQRHEIVRTIHGDFENHHILKQRFSFSTHYIGSNEVEECKFLVLHTEINGTFKIKICDFVSGEILPRHDFHIDQDSPGSLKAALIEYQGDAFEPFQLNSRVRIDHTANPMRLIINHGGAESGVADFYNRLQSSPQLWAHIKQISNLTTIVGNQIDDSEIIFELNNQNTLIGNSQHFDTFSQCGDGSKYKQDAKLRLRKGSKEIAANLETAIFLEGFNINSPVKVFINTFSKKFPLLMKMLWIGEMDSRIHQGREEFKLEDDLPALSFISNRLERFSGCTPKQNSDLWKDRVDYLSSEKLNLVLEMIEKNFRWPRIGYAHQMMHGDLTPANILVKDGDDYFGQDAYDYDLLLCDLHDVVAREKDGSTIYRTESIPNSGDSFNRVTSHFFETNLPPKINPMLDLSKFLANLLLKIPFEPSRREGIFGSIKLELRESARESRTILPLGMIRKQLKIALDWAERNIRDLCFLAEEGTKGSWRHLLKAMVFDQCLQIMVFWKSYRSDHAIFHDITPDGLIRAFWREELTEDPQAGKQIVRSHCKKIIAALEDLNRGDGNIAPTGTYSPEDIVQAIDIDISDEEFMQAFWVLHGEGRVVAKNDGSLMLV